MRDEADKRIGHLYPKATLPGGATATVIAWIWARTVTCPNPRCGITMPLVRSWWLSKKKGKETYVIPRVEDGKVRFSIGHGLAGAPSQEDDGTVNRSGARCIGCGAAVSREHIKTEGKAGRMGAQLMATVAEGNRTRIYLEPTEEHDRAADVPRPANVPEGELPYDPRNVWTPPYGLTTFADLFTPRQLTALTTFSDLVGEARDLVLRDAFAVGMPEGDRLDAGGTGATAYADAVATYLGLIISRLADYQSSITTWASNPQMEILRNMFARQAIPMSWDFAEGNLFAGSSGAHVRMTNAVTSALELLGSKPVGCVTQGDARQVVPSGEIVSTDPPYYDNVGYSDLSDFFYVWLRRSCNRSIPAFLARCWFRRLMSWWPTRTGTAERRRTPVLRERFSRNIPSCSRNHAARLPNNRILRIQTERIRTRR